MGAETSNARRKSHQAKWGAESLHARIKSCSCGWCNGSVRRSAWLAAFAAFLHGFPRQFKPFDAYSPSRVSGYSEAADTAGEDRFNCSRINIIVYGDWNRWLMSYARGVLNAVRAGSIIVGASVAAAFAGDPPRGGTVACVSGPRMVIADTSVEILRLLIVRSCSAAAGP